MLSKEIQQGIIQKADDINTNNPCKLRDEVKDIIDKLYRYINNILLFFKNDSTIA